MCGGMGGKLNLSPSPVNGWMGRRVRSASHRRDISRGVASDSGAAEGASAAFAA
jgi:hypothetical protein